MLIITHKYLNYYCLYTPQQYVATEPLIFQVGSISRKRGGVSVTCSHLNILLWKMVKFGMQSYEFSESIFPK